MDITNVHKIYFSPKGSTKKVVDIIAESFSTESSDYSLLQKEKADATFTREDLVIVGLPVYVGRIPDLCASSLKRLQGNNTPAVAAVVYGNRNYDDALLELTDILTEQGFLVVSAGAFIGEHSVFPRVATARPDQNDISLIKEFSEHSKTLLEVSTVEALVQNTCQVKGNKPYREAHSIPLKPEGDATCINCGVCSEICPMGAIQEATPRKTNKDLCISCGACIFGCKPGARNYRGCIYKIARKKFEKEVTERKTPEVFYSEA